MEYIIVLVNIIAFIILFALQKKFVHFNIRATIAFILGTLLAYFSFSLEITNTILLSLYNIIQTLYSSMLYVVTLFIIPTTIISSFILFSKFNNINGFKSFFVLSVVSSLILSMFSVLFSVMVPFNLNNIIISTQPNTVSVNTYYNLITILISLIITSSYFGIVKKQPNFSTQFNSIIEFFTVLIDRVYIVTLRISPYVILVISHNLFATKYLQPLLSLIFITIQAYVILIIIFIIQLIILMLFKNNVIKYIKNTFNILWIAFKTTSSLKTVDLNNNLQSNTYKINNNLSHATSTLSAVFVQHGCSSVYPSILLVGIALAFNIDPNNWLFLVLIPIMVTFVGIIATGLKGGYKITMLIILVFFNLPLEIFVILLVIDPIIDRLRTLININGNIITSLINLKINKKVLANE